MKKTWKKVVSLLLAMTLLAGCSSTGTNNSSTEATTAAVETATVETVSAVDNSDDSELTSADVVVVGAGAAGLSAAIKARQEGASVILLESQSGAGGTTKFSAVHYYLINEEMNSVEGVRDEALESTLETYLELDPADYGDYAESVIALQQQVTEYLNSDDTTNFDTVDRWLVDHYNLCMGTDRDGVSAHVSYELCKTAYSATEDIYSWLLSVGVTFEEEKFDVRGLTPVGTGAGVVTALLNTAEKEGVQIFYNTEAQSLIAEDGRVTGVVAVNGDGEEVSYFATNGVVLATGGYGSNAEMVAEYNNVYDGISVNTLSAEGRGDTGLGIVMAEELGAATVDLQFIELFAYTAKGACSIEDSIALRQAGKLAVNMEGVRYTNDSNGFRASGASVNQTDGRFFLIGDKATLDQMDANLVETYTSAGVLITADTIEEAAEAAGLDPAVVADTVATFNGYVDAGQDDEFGRTDFKGKVEEAPYMILCMAQCVQDTPGGLVINTDAQVLNTEGEVIEGLYAAGEVTGGLEGVAHSHGDNYQEIFYYGTTAGANAAHNK
jgi:fumarate reductase flavoprotein subunit